MINCEDPERELRRYSTRLVVCGQGLILYGFWSALRTLMVITMAPGGVNRYIEEISAYVRDDMTWFTRPFLICMVLIVILIATLIYIPAGLGAIREGKGRTGKWGYLVYTVFLLVLTLTDIPGHLRPTNGPLGDYDTVVASLVTDICCLLVLVSILYSSLKIRRIRRTLTAGSKA